MVVSGGGTTPTAARARARARKSSIRRGRGVAAARRHHVRGDASDDAELHRTLSRTASGSASADSILRKLLVF
jgi:hypothetical protein